MAQLCGSSGSAGLNLAMRGLSLSPYSYCRSFRAARSALIQSQRTISTSKGQKDVISQGVTPRIPSFEKPILPPLSEEQKKNWISYGFDLEDKKEDRNMMHRGMFLAISVLCVGGAVVLMYGPDYKLIDWSQREAYMELTRREKLGLPLIDRNLVDPARVNLPSDEELGDTEVII